uniref:Phospholipid/glycerol acyltransferase domain-containing protein n=1 Tax=Zooxanthella nutricula TaxID=1333877 RepID=A0A6U6NQE5_9DINO|mmetsp:Transcript_50490/g.153581  ORF Transcript_50490/g.153581 Transcript_50490/m.153581 type:complete len:323 (+) Transcript_50490:87-1055(+)
MSISCCDAFGTVLFSIFLVLCTLVPWSIAKVGSCFSHCCPARCPASRRLVQHSVVLFWRLLLWLSCWVRIRIDGTREFRRASGATGRPCVVVSNHLSFLDTPLLISLLPMTKVARVKLMVTSKMATMPFLRTIVRMTEHIIVPFARPDPECLEVDRDLMAVRLKELEDHMRRGGFAVWFPEGRLNSGDPTHVGTFRAGGFRLPARVDAEIWCIALVGTGDCWPHDSAVGGRPATVRGTIFRLCESSFECASTGRGGPGLGDESSAAKFLAESARQRIQRAVDDIAPLTAASSRTQDASLRVELRAPSARRQLPSPRLHEGGS